MTRAMGSARMFEERDDAEDVGDDGLTVTAKYVYRQFRRHEVICAARWWWVLVAIISVEATVIGAAAMLYLQKHV